MKNFELRRVIPGKRTTFIEHDGWFFEDCGIRSGTFYLCILNNCIKHIKFNSGYSGFATTYIKNHLEDI